MFLFSSLLSISCMMCMFLDYERLAHEHARKDPILLERVPCRGQIPLAGLCLKIQPCRQAKAPTETISEITDISDNHFEARNDPIA